MGFARRIAKCMLKVGEEFTIGANTYVGVFRPVDSGTLRTYLDDIEAMGVERPGLLLVTDGGASIAVDDTITRDGRTYTVLKTSNHRIAGDCVVKIAVLA